MSTDVPMLYEALYRLASKGSEDALFGTSAQLAQGAFQRASAGMPMPTIWFEVPLSGAPRFDLHVAHSNDDLHERAPYSSDFVDGHGELLNWYASEPRAGGGLALAYDVGDGRVDLPAGACRRSLRNSSPACSSCSANTLPRPCRGHVNSGGSAPLRQPVVPALTASIAIRQQVGTGRAFSRIRQLGGSRHRLSIFWEEPK